VLNTHLKYLAEALFPLGLRIERQLTVPDGAAIGEAVAESFGRAGVLLVTGGLGPTTDDVTREEVAALLGLELVHDPEIMAAIEGRFARRSLKMSPRNARQALRPPEATVLKNHHGTAPGLYLPPLPVPGLGKNSPHIFILPGPPRELRPMVEADVLPALRALLPAGVAAEMRNFRLAGLGESNVEERVGDALLALGVELGYCARPGEVDVRVIGGAEALRAAEKIIRDELGSALVSADGRSLEQVIVDLLTERGETLATAESCTGGGLANRVTNAPGASAVFMEGFVTYANAAKSRALGVDPALIAAHGAVSREVAIAMAEGARRVAGVDHALATTGVAGPGGGTPEKPVGTVFIALATKSGASVVEKHRYPTDRATFKDLTTQAALELLRRTITG
jgi:nicotinamide-nucleotide amidase